MALETDGVVDDFGGIPTEVSESRGEGDRGQSYRRRGTTAHTHWNTVAHTYVEGHRLPLRSGEDRFVRLDQEISGQPAADIRIAPGGMDGELGGGHGVDLQKELEGQRNGIKTRAQVGGGSRESQLHRLHA
jgi:hypothetical protein